MIDLKFWKYDRAQTKSYLKGLFDFLKLTFYSSVILWTWIIYKSVKAHFLKLSKNTSSYAFLNSCIIKLCSEFDVIGHIRPLYTTIYRLSFQSQLKMIINYKSIFSLDIRKNWKMVH